LPTENVRSQPYLRASEDSAKLTWHDYDLEEMRPFKMAATEDGPLGVETCMSRIR